MYGDDRRQGIDRPGWETERSQCFFLVADASDRLAPEGGAAEDATAERTVCRAFAEPLMVSDRQRDLVCLTRVHMTCPRYLRANAAVDTFRDDSSEEQRGARSRALLSKAFAAALAVALIVIALVAVAALASPFMSFIAANPSSTSGATAQTTVLPTATRLPTAVSSPTRSETAVPTPSGSPERTAGPKPTSSWPPGATASRMNLVTRCRDQAGCYFYTVRSGDSLRRIAAFFGVSYDAVLAMNPSITNPDYVQAGQTIRIPPPTR